MPLSETMVTGLPRSSSQSDNQKPTPRLKAIINLITFLTPRPENFILIVAAVSSKSSRYTEADIEYHVYVIRYRMGKHMHILLTGASGFIGTNLLISAAQSGHTVVAFSRNGRSLPGATTVVQWSLGDPLPEHARQKFDCAIHLAHDFSGMEGSKRTIDGTLSIMAALRDLGTRRQVLFSSVSAHAGAQSTYGQTKYTLEKLCRDQSDVIIVRPGLVLGNGGIFGRIRNWVRRYPFAPLPDGGRGQVRSIAIEELCEDTLRIVTSDNVPKEMNLFDEDSRTLRSLVKEEAYAMGRRVLIIPIPSGLLFGVLRTCEALALKLPVTSDNLSGFLANQSDIHQPSAWYP